MMAMVVDQIHRKRRGKLRCMIGATSAQAGIAKLCRRAFLAMAPELG